jgi:hypothetical protein
LGYFCARIELTKPICPIPQIPNYFGDLQLGTKWGARCLWPAIAWRTDVKRVSVAAFAEKAITSWGGGMISVPGLVSEIRKALPECEHTDDELAQLVSVIAVSKGRSLSFMRPSGLDL